MNIFKQEFHEMMKYVQVSRASLDFACRLKDVFWGTVISLLLLGPAGAEETSKSTEKHCLWKLKTETNSIYFLGSVHVLTKESYPLPEIFEKAYAAADKLIFETDPGGMTDTSFSMRLMSMGMYSDGQTIEQNIGNDTYQLLKEKSRNAGFPVDMLKTFKPWFYALSLTTLELNRLGFNPIYGIDIHFYGKAKADGKEVIGLETLDEHLAFLDQMSQEEQEEFLKQSMGELDILAEEAEEMVEYWKTGNVEKLHAMMKGSFTDYEDLYTKWVIQRNENWLPVLEKLITDKVNVMVIVGAGHLAGPGSLIDMLGNKGHRINQL